MRIAVARNVTRGRTVNVLSQPSPDSDDAALSESVADALREDGHDVQVYEGDARLLLALRDFLPSNDAAVTGMVFNLARGIQGEAPRSHVPAMLEMAGVPYTGPSPLGHALAFDTLAWRGLLTQAGISTTRHAILRWPGDEAPDLRFPMFVAPRYARAAFTPRLVLNGRQLSHAVEEIIAGGEHEAFVEEYVDSVEMSAVFIGNDDELELLPLVERHDEDPGDEGRVAGIGATSLGMRTGALAAAAFRACACQDYATVTVRIDPHGHPLVVGVDSMPRLDGSRRFMQAAVAGGYGPAAVVSRILDTAHRRYFGVPAPRFDAGERERRPARRLRLFSHGSR